MIDVVNEHAFRDIYDYSVHGYGKSPFLYFGPLASDGVICVTGSGGIPCVFAEPNVVIGVNNYVFSLREWYSSEGIAVAEPSVQENQ